MYLDIDLKQMCGFPNSYAVKAIEDMCREELCA